VLFNDMLGSTMGSLKDGKYTASKLNLFGTKLDNSKVDKYTYFTGKPHVEGLGYSFLFRNYREDLAKWQTSDPLGYPDGWNNFAYVNNGVNNTVDPLGTATEDITVYVSSVSVGCISDIWNQSFYYSNGVTVIISTCSYELVAQLHYPSSANCSCPNCVGHITTKTYEYVNPGNYDEVLEREMVLDYIANTAEINLIYADQMDSINEARNNVIDGLKSSLESAHVGITNYVMTVNIDLCE